MEKRPQQFFEKTKVVFIPFILISIGFICLYTSLHWYLDIEKGWINIKEDTIQFWLPIALPCLPILIWLNPRLSLLTFKTDGISTLYLIAAWIAIAVPTICAQQYLVAATGKMTEINDISQITQQAKTKYYKIEDYYFDKINPEIYRTSDVSGKYNESLNFHTYLAVPIRKDTIEDASFPCSTWLGLSYSKTVSNRLEDSEKETAFAAFDSLSLIDFGEKDLNNFIYFERIAYSDDLENYKEAIKACPVHKDGGYIIFKGINEPFEARMGEKYKWIFLSFGIGAIVWLIMLFFPALNEENLQLFKAGEPYAEQSDLADILEILIPTKDFFITPIIININILVFLIMFLFGLGFMSFKGDDLLSWGANYKPLVMEGAYWRLLTNIFLHDGVIHLLANMLGLVFMGIFLEPILGQVRFLLVYCCCGIMASLTSIWWYDATISIGASGAIFGLYGISLSLLLTNLFPKETKNGLLLSIILFVAFNLIMGFTGGVDNAAHIGGLISGLVIGLIIFPFLKKQSMID